MSEYTKTKNEIINRLKTGRKTVAELSDELGLAKSTVSQHLSELERLDVVHGEVNPHFRTEKYFELGHGAQVGFAISTYRERLLQLGVLVTAVLGVLITLFSGNLQRTTASAPMVPSIGTSQAVQVAGSNPYNELLIIAVIVALIVVETMLLYVMKRAKAKTEAKVNPLSVVSLLVLYVATIYVMVLYPLGICNCNGLSPITITTNYIPGIVMLSIAFIATNILLRNKTKLLALFTYTFLAILLILLVVSPFVFVTFVTICECPAILTS
ncbi:MAG: winged helix-turn-helix domain-containing protein [Candidatus Marsarchaeota archaeon]|nr:winged helix-turn-helix domain-containing protein [Candidatus Marsarchaeota archaeon]